MDTDAILWHCGPRSPRELDDRDARIDVGRALDADHRAGLLDRADEVGAQPRRRAISPSNSSYALWWITTTTASGPRRSVSVFVISRAEGSFVEAEVSVTVFC